MASTSQLITVFVTLSLTASITQATAYKSCNGMSTCPQDYFCNFDNKYESPTCNPCVNCSEYNRQSMTNCTICVSMCGACLLGYEVSHQNRDLCQPVSSKFTLWKDDTGAKTEKYAITTTEIIIVFALILPVCGLTVVGLTLLLGLLYKKEIRKKAAKDDSYFEYKYEDVIL